MRLEPLNDVGEKDKAKAKTGKAGAKNNSSTDSSLATNEAGALKSDNAAKADIPKDLQPYYKSGSRRYAGIAGGILIGLVILAALFFLGRFIIDKVSGDDDKANSGTSQSAEDQQEAERAAAEAERKAAEEAANKANQANQTPQPAPAPQPALPSTGG